ncbi:hypothetical protein QWZ06_17155 [Chryseobacterium tructae]|uniref:Uncharacterized protein n=1 Tax=Chryseobacterium tructae TaxID=1037380 RepID=A0ABV7Y0A4_9FLAO|nr:hypothetical protein [Chryseobacterium tructae]MDN3693888.1 hypothetical protein [Chryseobacterium tructae]
MIEVKEWLPGTTAQDKTKNLTWFLFDAKKKLIRKEAGITYGITIPKNLCGSYTYYIDASLSGKSEFKSGIYIRGRCDQKIKTSKWCTQNDGADVRKTYTFSYGHIIHLNLETEGMNGDSVYVDIFRRVKGGGGTKDDQHIHTYTDVKVIDGEINLQIGNTYLWHARIGKPGSQEEFYVKVKAGGKYITDGKDDIHARFLRIKNTIVSKAIEPSQSNTPAKVGDTNKSISSIGLISLEKIAVNTTYDVCNDELNNFSDFKNFWILEDKGNYYHWLKKRTNPLDTAKPNPIPVTITSLDKFIFYATFKAIFPIDNLSIRAKDKANKYVFQSVPITKQTKGQEFVVKFASDNAPYANTVEYFSNFALTFECSIDGKSWISCGNSQFCLYITHGNPGYSLLSGYFPDPIEGMDITNAKTGKKTILETMLYIGCRYSKGAKTDDGIIEGIFKHIATKNVRRVRNNISPMGYWRNTSSLHDSKMPFRNGRVLLKTGEARCGEWTSFLRDICRIQSDVLFPSGVFSDFVIFPGLSDYVYDAGKNFPVDINKRKRGILTSNDFNACFLVRNWTSIAGKAPIDNGGSAQDTSNEPLNMFWDHVFLKYKNQYFDPSYGLHDKTIFADDKALLASYSKKALSGVLYVNNNSKNTLIDAIVYRPKAGEFLDPLNPYSLGHPPKQKLRYSVINSKMENILFPKIIIS